MHREFEVVGEPPRQYLKTRLDGVKVKYSVYVPPRIAIDETRVDLILRAQKEVRQACPLGKNACGACVDLKFLFGHIIDPVIDCDLSNCPFDNGGGGGNSGDREPRSPIFPISNIAAEAGLDTIN